MNKKVIIRKIKTFIRRPKVLFIKALFNKLGILTTKNGLVLFLNLIRCESHRDLSIYLVRNLLFEPSAQKTKAIKIVKDIEAIFNKNMPVIISSHRLNFIGSLVKENRIQNLLLLDQVLREMIKKWEVEFMTSNQLGELISKDYSM